MGFLNRIADSLFSPKGLRAYANDKVIKVLLYLLFLICITLIPVIIDSPNYGKLSYETKLAIREVFDSETKKIDFKIENNKLVGKEEDQYFRQLTTNMSLFIGLNTDTNVTVGEKELKLANTGMVLCFLEDGVYLMNYVYKYKIISYEDYEQLEGIDFNKATIDDSEFWDNIFSTYSSVLKKFQPFLSIVYIGSSFVQALVMLLFYSVLVTWFNRFGMKVNYSFWENWRITVYGLTAFTLGNALALMINMSIFYYVGIIWSLIICIISTQNFIGRGENNEL